MKRYVAVIDLGKTNSKVALVDTATATEKHVVTQPSAVRTDTIYPSLDCDAIHQFILESLRVLSEQYRIDAIAVTTHGATVALVDASGKLALPVLDYEFQAIDNQRASYNQQRPTFAETGSPALPGGLNVGAQLYWQQANFPEEFASVSTVLTWPQYWVYRLTGEKHNDVSSLGAHTDLYEPDQQRYSTLVQRQGWSTLMPPTRLSGQLSGSLLPHIAQQTHLSTDTTVHTGIHDSNASLVPHLLTHDEPFTVVSTGTWLIIMAIGGESVELDETRDTLLNVNAYGHGVPSARFMGGRERELLGVTEQSCESGLCRLLSEPEDPAMLMPSVVKETGPFPQSKTQWKGQPIEGDDELRNSAVALYLALMTHECMQLIGSQGPTFIEGPLAHDEHFGQMLATVSQRPVQVGVSQTGTSVGAALLIQAPEEPPLYRSVKLDATRQSQLQRYASRWQRSLAEHVATKNE